MVASIDFWANEAEVGAAEAFYDSLEPEKSEPSEAEIEAEIREKERIKAETAKAQAEAEKAKAAAAAAEACGLDHAEFECRALHAHSSSFGCRISFFKNAICCWRYTISFWSRCSLSLRDIFANSALLKLSLLIRIRDFLAPCIPSGV